MVKLFQNSLFNGIIQIILSVLWIWHYGILLYYYNFTDILFAFIVPTWTIILFILMGILGIIIGISVCVGKQKIKKGYFQIFCLLIIGVLIDLIVIGLG